MAAISKRVLSVISARRVPQAEAADDRRNTGRPDLRLTRRDTGRPQCLSIAIRKLVVMETRGDNEASDLNEVAGTRPAWLRVPHGTRHTVRSPSDRSTLPHGTRPLHSGSHRSDSDLECVLLRVRLP